MPHVFGLYTFYVATNSHFLINLKFVMNTSVLASNSLSWKGFARVISKLWENLKLI